MKVRDSFFDVVKMAAIFMVVFGHVQTASEMIWGAPYIKNFIIGVNMPLFFTISGYFVHQMDAPGSWKYLVKRVASLLWPALVVSMILCIAKIVLAGHVEFWALEWLWGKFVSFWFLWVLSGCVLIGYCMDRVHIRGGVILFCASLMFMPSERFYADKILQMLPFFMMGRYLLDDMINAIKRFRGLGLTCIYAYTLIILFSGNVYDNGMGFYWNHVSWIELLKNSNSVILWIARFATAVIGVFAVLYVFDVGMKFNVLRKLSCLGTTTLGVYILHQDILTLISPILSPNPMVVFAMSVVLLLFCHFLIMITKKINWINAFLWEFPRKVVGGRAG